jgi:RNA polymerase sigma-70 factor (ECF subfamily)
MDTDTDVALLQSLIGGDQAALGQLYDRHAPAIYRTAYRLLGEQTAAEEVVQETMLTLWDRAEAYDPKLASLGGWLATIARNRSIDRLRVRGRRLAALPLSSFDGPEADDPEAADRALENGAVLGVGQAAPEPSAAAEAVWLRESLARAVASLPEPERRVIELAYSHDLTQSEIAARLGWPLGTVKTRTRRALGTLRAALHDELDVEGHAAPTIADCMPC